tara:strand:+ start:9296 stop:9535 length:240 start_codon:yes stop_codon:yes gene_type:complete
MKLFGKHRVRTSFYHIGALLFLCITALTYMNILSDSVAFILTSILFVVDYIAEMFDPHPDNMGTWYERYFHRFFEDDTE